MSFAWMGVGKVLQRKTNVSIGDDACYFHEIVNLPANLRPSAVSTMTKTFASERFYENFTSDLKITKPTFFNYPQKQSSTINDEASSKLFSVQICTF